MEMDLIRRVCNEQCKNIRYASSIIRQDAIQCNSNNVLYKLK